MFNRHPEVAASSAALDGRRPGWQLGRSSFEARGTMLRIAPLAPQDDGVGMMRAAADL